MKRPLGAQLPRVEVDINIKAVMAEINIPFRCDRSWLEMREDSFLWSPCEYLSNVRFCE